MLYARLQRFVDEAESVVAAESGDPGGAFFAFLTSWIEMSSAKNAYFEALTAAGVTVPKTESDIGARLIESLGVLLSRAQGVGAVRDDLVVGELITVIIGTARAAEYAGPDARLRDRAVAILFDGLRPRVSGGARLSRSAPAWAASRSSCPRTTHRAAGAAPTARRAPGPTGGSGCGARRG